MSGKNLRLLGAERSPAWQADIHETISALQEELAKGASVYTPAELDKLTNKLAEYRFMLQRMTEP